MKHLLFCSLVIAACGASCSSRPKLSPEATVQAWQSCIDKNEFDRAREMSQGEALRYIDELAGYNTGVDTLAWENNVLLKLQCRIVGDSAVCTYHFEDELGEPVPGQLGLRLIEGYWYVTRTDFDVLSPADTLQPGDSDMLFPEDSLEGELE